MCKVLSAMLLAVTATMTAAAAEVPFNDPRWTFVGDTADIVDVNGREALRLVDAQAALAANFGNGVIEFDIMVTPERGFHGVFFRTYGQNDGENFYIRPHASGNEDANQYTPLFNGLTAWQLYYGPWFSAPTEYRFDAWMHIKLVVSGARADVYIDSEEPVLSIAQLKNRPVAGDIVLSSNFAPAYFADFSYRESADQAIVGTSESMPAPEPGIVRSWQVSSPFDEASLDGATSLSPKHLEGLEWRSLAVEDRGYANLSRVVPFGEKSNTTFARLFIESESATVQNIRFGYSDRVRVYLNGDLLYVGDNGYRTRDYRYLGTIGLFDAVPLRLKEGRNELLFAVSESFGGWGIMAQLEQREGVVLTHEGEGL